MERAAKALYTKVGTRILFKNTLIKKSYYLPIKYEEINCMNSSRPSPAYQVEDSYVTVRGSYTYYHRFDLEKEDGSVHFHYPFADVGEQDIILVNPDLLKRTYDEFLAQRGGGEAMTSTMDYVATRFCESKQEPAQNSAANEKRIIFLDKSIENNTLSAREKKLLLAYFLYKQLIERRSDPSARRTVHLCGRAEHTWCILRSEDSRTSAEEIYWMNDSKPSDQSRARPYNVSNEGDRAELNRQYGATTVRNCIENCRPFWTRARLKAQSIIKVLKTIKQIILSEKLEVTKSPFLLQCIWTAGSEIKKFGGERIRVPSCAKTIYDSIHEIDDFSHQLTSIGLTKLEECMASIKGTVRAARERNHNYRSQSTRDFLTILSNPTDDYDALQKKLDESFPLPPAAPSNANSAQPVMMKKD
jgi:hypothetical protein